MNKKEVGLTIVAVLVAVMVIVAIYMFFARPTNTVVVNTNPVSTMPILPSGVNSGLSAEVAKITGTAVCLPHKNPGEMQTMECALGVKTDSGENYAVNLMDLPNNQFMDFSTGSRFTLTGQVTPVESLPTGDNSLKYDIKGTIKVSEMVKL